MLFTYSLNIYIYPHSLPTENNNSETGTVYYIDNTHQEASNDNPGTQFQPWETIQHGMNTVKAADTLIVRAGTYEEAVSTEVNGTVDLPITVKSFPGETVIVDRFWFNHSHYRIEGFTISASKYSSIYICPGISDIEIINNIINVTSADNVHAINCPGGSNSHYTNNLIIKDNTFGPSTIAGGFCVRLRGYGHLISNNTFNYWNGHDAICMQARESIISNNTFNSISHCEETEDHPDCIQIYVEENSMQNNVIVESNIFKNCSGQVIRMYQNPSRNQYCPNWTIRNNMFINSGAKALQARGDNCRVYNNLFYMSTVNTSHPLGFLSDNKNSAVINNMFIGCGNIPDSGNQGWWNEDEDAPVEHRNNYITGYPDEYNSKSRFVESSGINGSNPMFVNAHIAWVWADNNGDDYDGSSSSFEISEGDLDKFKIGHFIEYSPFISGADSKARKIVSIEGNIVHFTPPISNYKTVDCGITKSGHFPDGDICNIYILLWGEQDWRAGDTIIPDYSIEKNSPARNAGTDLSATGFTNDILGHNRDDDWDIGPYEYSNKSPYIIKQPIPRVIEVDKDVRFFIETVGDSEPNYQWLFEGYEVHKNNASGVNSAVLKLSNVTLEDEGYYRVVVSNNMGSVISDEAFLNVVDEVPEISDLNCTVEFNKVYLSWDNPDIRDNDWDKVLVVRKRDEESSSPEDGEEIYCGRDISVIDGNLNNGIYHYSVYTYKETDTGRVYSEAVTAEVVVTDVLNNTFLRIDSEEGRIKIGQNTRGDLYSLWNEERITIGGGPTGNEISLWLYSDIIGNDENQIPAGSKIVSARLVFTVDECSFIGDENISEVNSENGNTTTNITPYSDNVGNPAEASYVGRSIYGSDAHCIKLYQISDPDNLGLPYYADDSGVRVGLDFNYRDHRPGIDIPWLDIDENDEEQVDNEEGSNESLQNNDTQTRGQQISNVQNQLDQYKPGSIYSLMAELEPIDILEFSPDVFKDGKAKTLQLDITEVVQSYSDKAAVNSGDGSASEEQGIYITIDYGWNKGEYISFYGSSAEVENVEGETEEGVSGIRPYMEIIYSDGTDDLTGPAPVQGLTVIPGNDNVELSWTNPSDSNFIGVKIIRREGIIPYNIQDGSNGGEGVFVDFLEETDINPGSEVIYTDSNLLPGHRYYYAVYTYDDSYNFSKPVWIKGVIGSPLAPVLNTPVIAAGEVTLSWEKVTGAGSYRIYYEDNEGNNILIDEVVDENPENQGTELEYTDYLPAGEYIYRVSAVNENGEGPLSEELLINIVDGPTQGPGILVDLLVEVMSSSEIKINWTDHSNNEIGFVVERKTGDSDWEEVGKTRYNRTEYIDSELLPATQYTYRIKAFNSAGETYSDIISCTTEDGPVQQITSQLISASQIRVEWEDVMDGVSYRIEIYELEGNDEIIKKEAVDAQISSGLHYCYFVKLESAKEYKIKVITLKNNEEIGAVQSDIIRTSMDPKGGLF